MAARRMKSLMHGNKKHQDGVVWHREHRSKKGRQVPINMSFKRRKNDRKVSDAENNLKEALNKYNGRT